MAEILVTEIRARRLSAAGDCFCGVDMTRRCVSTSPNVPCLHCSAHCFFHCFPLFLRRRLFSRDLKALHCNWPGFSIADRLYFSRKFSGPFLDCTPPVRHENERL